MVFNSGILIRTETNNLSRSILTNLSNDPPARSAPEKSDNCSLSHYFFFFFKLT